VTDGRVQLFGTLWQECDRGAIRGAAETIPGVVSVVDHLVFVEPSDGKAFGPDMSSTG
jgi:osmotically-inducible protein OsmY